MPEPTPLRLLIVEDSDDDAVLICEELRRGGFEPIYRRVESAGGLRNILSQEEFDVIVSDYSLPQFTALEALKIVQATGKDVPVIVVSGSVRESTVVDTMRAGARDYVMKENLTRLPLAVRRELEEAGERHRRRQLDEQVRHNQRLESLGVLAGGVAHDFNNLLTGIMGNVSLALEATPPAGMIPDLLQQALQAAEQAANLTRQMLAYAGKGKFFIERLDISAAVREISALLQASISKNISLLFELSDDLPLIEADRGQIQQLLMNLVINAAEAIGPEQPGTILVSTASQHLNEGDLRNAVVWDHIQPGTYVSLEVRDTGQGMDFATQHRIFDPFFTTKFTGRGLGLSAVLGIVRSHKGTLRVQSEPHKGSAFTVFLPGRKGLASLPQPRAQGNEAALPGSVLVIDDEETIRHTAKTILERRGMHVLVADSGRAGVDTFRRLSDRISLVLLDLTMPLMGGNEVLREIRAVRRDVAVILSSGFDEIEAMHRVDAAEVSAFIQKPYTAAQLLEKVRAATFANSE